MLVRVKMVGSGKFGDEYRAPLPAYKEVLTLHEQGLVYALIPDDDHPEFDKNKSAKFEQTGHGAALIGLDADGLAAWYSHLDKRYAEHEGKFRPEIA